MLKITEEDWNKVPQSFIDSVMSLPVMSLILLTAQKRLYFLIFGVVQASTLDRQPLLI